MKQKKVKVSIIGAGFVGSTTAYTLMTGGLASEIVIVDINKDKALAEAMDLSHGASFVRPVDVIAGDYEDTKDSDIIIITAGVGPKPGETRLDIINKNLVVFKSIVPEIVKYSPNSIILVISNPVDILTYITYKLSGFPPERVIGSGTLLDTSRFRYMLSEHFNIDARNIHAYIIGEHGDSEIATWSSTSIAGMNLQHYCSKCSKCDGKFKYHIAEKVKNAAYDILSKKGYTNYAVALSVKRIVEAIVGDEKSILTLSSLFTGQYGIEGVYMGIPTVIGSGGVERVLEIQLNDEETKRLKESGRLLSEYINKANI